MGLAIAHQLTRLLGGELSCHNLPSGGAAFTVSLPGVP